MPINLSIKNVPDELVARLRERAARNHRSVQGELMALIERAIEAGSETSGMGETRMRYRDEMGDGLESQSGARGGKVPLRWPSQAARLIRDIRDLEGNFEDTPDGPRRMRRLNASEILKRMRALDIRTPGSATDIVRQMRDERHR